MCAAIWMTGLAVQLFLFASPPSSDGNWLPDGSWNASSPETTTGRPDAHSIKLIPMAALGGALWATGNTLSVPDMHSAKREPITCTLDALFDHESSQKEVYDAFAEPCVADFLRGINATIFAYGQTGSGKTFTMMGTSDGSVSGMYTLASYDIIELLD